MAKAECPLCFDKWNVDLRYAKLNDGEKKSLQEHNFFYVICEDCETIKTDCQECGESYFLDEDNNVQNYCQCQHKPAYHDNSPSY